MKHLLLTIIPIMLLIGCQKELNTPLNGESTSLNAIISIQQSRDSVIFDPIVDGTSYTNGDGRVTCFLTTFDILYDSLYTKDFKFLITKSESLSITKAKLYIDGIRVKTLYGPLTDTLDFFKKRIGNNTITLVDPANEAHYTGKHAIAVDLAVTGPAGSSYQLTLVEAALIHKVLQEDQYPASIIGLPVKGWTFIMQ